METRGDSEIYGEFYRYVDGSKKSITYLIGVIEWKSNTSYTEKQFIKYFNGTYFNIYVCLSNHVSSSLFTNDTARWKQITYDIQEVRDDVTAILPLQHDPVTNTFSIKQATTSNVDGGYLSKDDWNIFNNKQEKYSVRVIGSIANTVTFVLTGSDSLGEYDIVLSNTALTKIISKFSIIYSELNTLDLYIKNDENLITETQNNSNTFNVFIGASNLINFQNNLGYDVVINAYRRTFKDSFDPLNP